MSERDIYRWWKGACIYQVYPRSFLDTNGDGIGDLPGITRGLDHIANLGVDAIWLSPFFTSPMKDFGYDVADYCDVDPIFGSLADFDRLVERAHALGLKVIIDQVYSHTSDHHDWFQSSRDSRTGPKADWYVWADAKSDGTPPNNWQSVFGGPAWTWDARRGQYYLHNFLESQPDLNLHNPDVQDALLHVTRFWLDRAIDGFRLDAINFAMHDPGLRDNPAKNLHGKKPSRPIDFQELTFNQSHRDIASFLSRVRSILDAYGAIFSVAEVAGPDPLTEMKAYTHGETHLHSAYNFDFLYAEDMTPAHLINSLSNWGDAPDEGWPSWAFSNHDAPRAISRWASEHDAPLASRFYALLLIALRGNIFIYQGEELGLPQAHVAFDDLRDPEAITNWPMTLGRDGARTPIPWDAAKPFAGFSTRKPWLPLDPRHTDLAISEQSESSVSVLNYFRTVIALRRNETALRYGDIEFVRNLDDGILAFYRRVKTETLLCIFNFANKAQSAGSLLRSDSEIIFATSWPADDSDTLGLDTMEPDMLAPLSGMIIRVD